jgi:NADH dehydrogenase (ubiquinone) 1 beta subcomplex subunit 8
VQNGGYVNPPRVKRQFRDPYGDWWDKQERRNYGEPVHEDNDILGMFSPEEYTHTKPGKGLFQVGCFVAAVFALCGVVSMTYPDKPSAPREFEGGLERELGGPGALRVSLTEEMV